MAPAQSRFTFQLCRRFVAVDGTFLKGRFVLTLLLAVGIDADGHNVILAWAVVESENRSSWEYFLCHLRNAIPEIASQQCVLVSDRDKGLLQADEVLGPHVVRGICCKHLCANFTDKYGRSLEAMFWKAARSKTEAGFDAALAKIAEVKAEAALYLGNTVRCIAAFPLICYYC